MPKMSFRAIADHAVLSHLAIAKKVVSFKTFTSSMADHPSNFNAQFFGGIAFGTNVFLRCHTDEDFTFSIIQVFLKGTSQYLLDEIEYGIANLALFLAKMADTIQLEHCDPE